MSYDLNALTLIAITHDVSAGHLARFDGVVRVAG